MSISITPRHFLSQARDYCEQVGVSDIDDLERVRLSMCVRELRERMKPWNDALLRLHPVTYGVAPGEPMPQGYIDLQAQVDEIMALEAKRLGLEFPTAPVMVRSASQSPART